MTSAGAYVLTAGKTLLVGVLLVIALVVAFYTWMFMLIAYQELTSLLTRRRFMHGLAGQPRPGVYLMADDVQTIRNYMHFIPVGRGWSQRLVAENYPGWDWNAMVTYLTCCDVLVNSDNGLIVSQGWTGVLLDGHGGCTFDNGNLKHPLKDAWKAPKTPDTSVIPQTSDAAIELTTGLEVP
jgi:hypothetical protein